MRFKIIMHPEQDVCTIPINYQYQLSCEIYKIIQSGSGEYAKWLESKGYCDAMNKPHRLFVFSWLSMKSDYEIKGSNICIKNRAKVELYISSPMLEDFRKDFIVNLFEKQTILLGADSTDGKFNVDKVVSIPTPEFKSPMRFKALSPITLSISDNIKPSYNSYYDNNGDLELSEVARKNLIYKYKLINKQLPRDKKLTIKLDDSYIKMRGGFDKVTKLITLKESPLNDSIRVKSFICPLTITGSTELIKTAYECGIGEKNSLGFGMVVER